MAWLSQNMDGLLVEMVITVLLFAVSWVFLRIRKANRPHPQTTKRITGGKGFQGEPRHDRHHHHHASRQPPQRLMKSDDNAGSSAAAAAAKALESSAEPNVLITAIRKGRVSELPYLLDEACHKCEQRADGDRQVFEEQARAHLLRVLRTCASAQQYASALSAYDHMHERIGSGCRATWSLLLYNAVEAAAFDRGLEFYNKLTDGGSPSGQDVVNVIRCLAHRRDMTGLKQVMEAPVLVDVSLDAGARNRAIAACCMEGALEFAEVVAQSKAFSAPLDVPGYNTLIKGYARRGKLNRCLELERQMTAEGLEPSEMTLGILLDACTQAKDFRQAAGVCKSFDSKGRKLNKVHMTTIIKGLVASGQLDHADSMLRDMQESLHIQPDIITYQTLVKAHMERGKVEAALRLVQQMKQQDLKPDALMCDCIFAGCCGKGSDAATALQAFNIIAEQGVSPSSNSVMLLVRSLAEANAFEEALVFLTCAKRRYGVCAEAHLYGQLGLACVRAGRMEMAQKVHDTMEKQSGEQCHKFASCRLLKHCIQCPEEEAKAIAFGPPAEAPHSGSGLSAEEEQNLLFCSPALAQRIASAPQATRLAQFVAINQLGAVAAQALSELPGTQAEWIMDEGFLLDARSAALVLQQRVQAVKEMPQTGWEKYPEAADLKRRLDNFIEINNLDKRCAETLRRLSRTQVLWVMDQEFYIRVDPTKGSAAAKVISFVRKVWASSKRPQAARDPVQQSMSGAPDMSRLLEEFVSVNRLDERCQRLLKSLSFADAAWVMDQEFVISVDPNKGTASAKVVSLINKAKQAGNIGVFDHHHLAK
eukprot:TRINITY_DN7162_c0_g3_i1.p1 TRINITY_DN7162_c0_g3~~TRINITY_DN7162_c0_g3_i1.p1  ORF type:complete len:818 (+),score=257.78 TRINITY_DN7162_c0_g3_i1:125-2578(+)